MAIVLRRSGRRCDLAYYERLSALDAAYLEIETPNCHMHTGVTMVFEAAPLTLEHGGLDIERIRRFVEAGIARAPRYRQRLEYVPLQRHPVWVDDESFNIHYHVRHTALPRPGSLRQLKRMAARIGSQKLDRSRPLWELWVVEGLEGGRFAVIVKVHHCMVDGVSGAELMAVILRMDTSAIDPEPPAAWSPRPAPTRAELLGDEVRRRTDHARTLFGRLAKLRDDPQQALDGIKELAGNVFDTVGNSIAPASVTPLNPQDIGAYRRVDWRSVDLSQAKAVKNALGGKINDVVMATVTGALRRYFEAKGAALERLDYRALMPVSTRQQGAATSTGPANKVSVMVTRLPLEVDDVCERFERVTALISEAKASWQQSGVERVEELGELAATSLISRGMQLATRFRSYNLVVTNIPGPPIPLYLLGAKLCEVYPVVPLYLNQALGIAVISYDGRLFWGFNAEWDSVPDLHELSAGFETEFAILCDAAEKKKNESHAERAP